MAEEQVQDGMMEDDDEQPTGKGKGNGAVNAVVMKDGRTVDFPGSRKMKKVAIIKEGEPIRCRFDFTNAETRWFTMPPKMERQFAGHGALQKIGDSASGEKEVDDMVVAIETTIQQCEAGEWKVKREAGGFSGTSLVIRAVAEATGKSIDEVKAGIETKLAALKAAGKDVSRQALYASFRQNPKVAEIHRRLEDERNKSKAADVDTEALLEEFKTATVPLTSGQPAAA